jgi:vacuolar-type H+-ATPase subunit I/STV1
MAGEEGTTPDNAIVAASSGAPTVAVDPNDLSVLENVNKLPPHVQSYVNKLKADKQAANDEAAARRALLRETQAERETLKNQLEETKTKELEEAGQYKTLYEQERAAKETLIQESNKRITRAELRAHAINEGIIDPEIADLIPIDKVTVDAAGNIVGVVETIASYKLAKPNLFKSAQAQAAPAPVAKATGSAAPEPGAQPTAQSTASDRDRIKKMSKEDYAQFKRDQVAKLRR